MEYSISEDLGGLRGNKEYYSLSNLKILKVKSKDFLKSHVGFSVLGKSSNTETEPKISDIRNRTEEPNRKF